MTPHPDHGHQPADDRGRLVRSSHTSPRIGHIPARFRGRSPLRAEHRHVLPSRQGPLRDGEDGFSTAELLGNAALGIAALIAIWVVLEALGVSVVAWIGNQIGVS